MVKVSQQLLWFLFPCWHCHQMIHLWHFRWWLSPNWWLVFICYYVLININKLINIKLGVKDDNQFKCVFHFRQWNSLFYYDLNIFRKFLKLKNNDFFFLFFIQNITSFASSYTLFFNTYIFVSFLSNFTFLFPHKNISI